MANKNFIKIAKLIIFLLIFGFLGSYFGNEYFLLKSEVLDKTKEIAKLQLENKKTTELRDKLAICLEDGAIATVEEARGYSFEEFGLYSPDFEGKIINPVSFEYKNNIISK